MPPPQFPDSYNFPIEDAVTYRLLCFSVDEILFYLEYHLQTVVSDASLGGH